VVTPTPTAGKGPRDSAQASTRCAALFPSYLGNSQYQRIVLIQACELWGVLGLSFAIVLVNSAAHRVLAWALSRGPFPAVGVGVTTAMLAGMLTFGFYTVGRLDETVARTEQSLTVGLVQTNMGIYEKTQHPEEGLRRHRDQSLEAEAAGAELIIWPESGYYYALSPSMQNVKREVLGRLRTPLLFGGMRVQPGPLGEELYNSAFLTDGEGTLRASYDKTHLLAFGEYLPGGELLPWMYGLSPQTSHFYRGKHVRPMPFRGMRLGVLICYEDILPQFVRHVMDEHPDILINITNDAWFGQSNEPRIHLALATFRAIEQRRFLVRATNTGISAIVDPAGRILHETPVFARANLIGTVKPMYGLTAYQQLGDWPAYGSAALALGALLRPWLARLRRTAARRAG
jgi:apolipoprotein N-acyltransferase